MAHRHMGGVVALTWPPTAQHFLPILDPSVQLVLAEAGERPCDTVHRLLQASAQPRRVLLHIDCSTPADFSKPFDELARALFSTGVAVWNARITDIRKRTLQSTLAALGLPTTLAMRDGPGEERLVIKTDLNARGMREWRASDAERAALGWGPRTRSPLQDHPDYIVATRRSIPSDWWTNHALIFERYVDNRYGIFYRAYFVGESVVLCEGRSTKTIRRMHDAVDRSDFLLARSDACDVFADVLLGEPARDAFKSALVCADRYGLDYGCVDMVVDNAGVPFIIDVNSTPSWGSADAPLNFLRHLRRGWL